MAANPIDAIKGLWHDDLCRRADTHAWVLSLYRAGELHPQTVDDYFPVAAAESAALAAAMEQHAGDEVRHVKIYDAAIAKLGEPRTDFAGLDVFNVVIREETPARFDMRGLLDRDARDARRARLAHFLAHAHFLEKRIARSLEYHLAACERVGKGEVFRAVAAVHADEARHQRYTREAVFELLPRPRAERVLALHRAAERRANLRFSARQVRAFLARFAPVVPRSHARLYRAAAKAMEIAHAAV